MRRKTLTIILTIIMLTFLLLPAVVWADYSGPTDVTIHKLQMDDAIAVTPQPHDGSELTDAELDALLNTDTSPLPGVTFTWWKITDSLSLNELDALSIAQLNTRYTTTATAGPTSDPAGTVTISAMAVGTYYFRETVTPANVSGYEAVPFMLELPVMNHDGTAYITDLHIYPKNYTIYGAVLLTKFTGTTTHLPNAVFSLYQGISPDGTLQAAGLTTDSNGYIMVNNLPEGDYYFVETAAPAGYVLNTSPITIAITASGAVQYGDGGEADGIVTKTGTVVEVSAENHLPSTISKEADKTSAGYSENITFTLKPTVTGTIQNYTKLVIRDVLDTRLDYTGNLTVTAWNGTQRISLQSDTHYTADKPADGSSGTLTVTFAPAQLTGLSAIQVSYHARINETAAMGTDIPNTASLTFNTGSMPADATEDSNEVNVYTSGKQYIKQDNSATPVPLAGAEFVLYREATGGEPPATIKEYLVIGPAADEHTWVTDQAQASVIVSAATTGLIDLTGLADGTYYLQETKAPYNGTLGRYYNLLVDPVAVVVTKDSYDATPTATIVNVMGPLIPETGGYGTLIYTIAGLGLMGSALVIGLKKGRPRR